MCGTRRLLATSGPSSGTTSTASGGRCGRRSNALEQWLRQRRRPSDRRSPHPTKADPHRSWSFSTSSGAWTTPTWTASPTTSPMASTWWARCARARGGANAQTAGATTQSTSTRCAAGTGSTCAAGYRGRLRRNMPSSCWRSWSTSSGLDEWWARSGRQPTGRAGQWHCPTSATCSSTRQQTSQAQIYPVFRAQAGAGHHLRRRLLRRPWPAGQGRARAGGCRQTSAAAPSQRLGLRRADWRPGLLRLRRGAALVPRRLRRKEGFHLRAGNPRAGPRPRRFRGETAAAMDGIHRQCRRPVRPDQGLGNKGAVNGGRRLGTGGDAGMGTTLPEGAVRRQYLRRLVSRRRVRGLPAGVDKSAHPPRPDPRHPLPGRRIDPVCHGRRAGGADPHRLLSAVAFGGWGRRAGAECAPAPAVSAMDSRPTIASDSHPEKGSSICISRMPFCGVVRRSMLCSTCGHVSMNMVSTDRSFPAPSYFRLPPAHPGEKGVLGGGPISHFMPSRTTRPAGGCRMRPRSGCVGDGFATDDCVGFAPGKGVQHLSHAILRRSSPKHVASLQAVPLKSKILTFVSLLKMDSSTLGP